MNNNFTENEYQVLVQLLSYNQEELKKFLFSYLTKQKYNNIKISENSIMAEGDIPIALVAHLDTVFKSPSKKENVLWDKEKGVIINPVDGAGFDDRAGVFAILQILSAGLRPHIVFTCNEETTGAGAIFVSKNNIFKDIRYVIELDRQGINDCVFYNCCNQNFIKYITDFGFVEAFGTFSDISIICPEWKIAGVNLSIGYKDEHSYIERFYTKPYKILLAKIIKMLNNPPEKTFEYVSPEDNILCKKCNTLHPLNDLFPVYNKANNTNDLLCLDCCIKLGVEFCNKSGKLIIPDSEDNNV